MMNAIQQRGDDRCEYCGGTLDGKTSNRCCPKCALTNALDGESEERPGNRIGRYRVREKIGEGGCGMVYLAEQEEPVRRVVALKVIKPGMDSKSVIARFEAERQALAMMDHPNIARVVDADTTGTGAPYFVMELVRGIPITEFCDQNKVSIGDRLELAIQVCQAVQHAHQKGIIHRDLKPSNILVTMESGVSAPKVIDFGIAKARQGRLTDLTVCTGLLQFIGSPVYMSPEQAQVGATDVDTRSDIYSLGVLLYELLTGTTPFDGAGMLEGGFEQICRTLREQEPVRPSTRLEAIEQAPLRKTALNRRTNALKLIQFVRGDLDCIILKCLEKDRARRYDTANDLAMELKRFLENEPILARTPGTAYRVRQAVRRHKFGVTAAAAVTAALVAGLVTTTWQWNRARDAWLRERRNAYAAQVNVAFQALAENNLGRARDLLEQQRPDNGEDDLRGFEWRYLWTLCRGDEIASFTDPAANAVAFSPDGKVFAYGSTEITVRETASRNEIAKLRDETAGGKPSVKLFGGELGIRTLSFSPDGRFLACAVESGTALWDTATWKKVRTLPATTIPTEFSPDGSWLMTGTATGLKLWNTKTWESAGKLTAPAASQFSNRYNSAFSPDSKRFVTVLQPAGLGARSLMLCSVPDMQPEPELPLPGASAGSVRFSADGKFLFVGKWDGELALLNIASGKFVKTQTEHGGWIRSIAVAADGRTVVTASSDRTVIVWDAESLTLRTRLRGHVGEVRGIALASGGNDILSASTDGTTKLWSTQTRHDEDELAGVGIVAGFLPDGTVLGASRDKLVLWNPGTAAQHETLLGKDALPIAAGPNSIAFTFQGKAPLAAVGKLDGTIEIWNLEESTRVQRWPAHDTPANVVAFTPDMRLLASGSTGGELKIWDTATERVIRQLEGIDGVIRGLKFSHDGKKIAACGDSSRVFVWEAATGASHFVSGDHGGPETIIDSVSFSPDGELLAATTLQSNETHLWELRSGRRRHVLKGHIQGVKAAAFSPDNRTLATASGDRKVKLWNVATGQQLATFALPERCISIAFSPDGNSLAVGCSAGTGAGFIRVWRAADISETGQSVE